MVCFLQSRRVFYYGKVSPMSRNLILCPVYNEHATLETFMNRLFRSTEAHILFIDDGSTDDSTEIIRERSEKVGEKVYLLCHHTRRGYGAALISGFQAALQYGYERVVTIDTDLQHRPEDIHRFEMVLEYSDVVLGTRYSESLSFSHVPRSRYLINRYISGLLRKSFSVCFSDPFCGFRGYRRAFLERIHLSEQSYGICLEMLLEIIRTGTEYDEVPVDRIYLDENRQFMDGLENPLMRLDYYKNVINRKWHTLKEQSIAVHP